VIFILITFIIHIDELYLIINLHLLFSLVLIEYHFLSDLNAFIYHGPDQISYSSIFALLNTQPNSSYYSIIVKAINNLSKIS
jgi:hypothetical protein